MINENKIREACASNRERGFKMLKHILRIFMRYDQSTDIIIYRYLKRVHHLLCAGNDKSDG